MRERLTERLRRLLLMIPYVLERPGVGVAEVCERFQISPAQLAADLNLLFMCGLPGYGPGDLIEASIDGDQVVVRMADYFARPPRLTPGEGLLLYTGAKALAAAGVAGEALDRAAKVLEQLLGPEVVERVSVELGEDPGLAPVKRALEGSRRLRLTYWALSKDEVTEREVDPWALFASAGSWYLVGWCHRAGGDRLFRIDRVIEAEVLDETAEPPADLDLSTYQTLYVQGPGSTAVTLDLAPPAASWVSEYYPLESQETLGDRWVRIRLQTGATAWLENLLLRLGRQARVVEPEELAARVSNLACRLAERYR